MPFSLNDGQIQVLRALHFRRGASRRELSVESGLSPQSLSRIASELLDTGYIVEHARRRTGGMGQPAIELQIASRKLLSLGLVLEHDRITCVLSDLADGIFHRARVGGRFLSASQTAAAAEALVAEVIGTLPPEGSLLGLGISQSGFFFQSGTQRIVAIGDIEGWLDMDLAARLSDRFGLDVQIENDGRVAATGHMVHGIGMQFPNFFVVLMTRGIGGGGVANRRLIRGRAGNAGELPMLLPTREGIRPSLANLGEQFGLGYDDPDLLGVVERALADGDSRLLHWLNACGAMLQDALYGVSALLDPEAIIFAGRMPIAIRAALAERVRLSGPSIGDVMAPAPRVVIDPAEDCLEIGAASLPIAKVFAEARVRRGAA